MLQVSPPEYKPEPESNLQTNELSNQQFNQHSTL